MKGRMSTRDASPRALVFSSPAISVCTSTYDELAAFPGYVLRDGQWRVSKVIAEFLGRPFLAVADLPTIDDHIMLVGAVVDAERAKGEIIETHLLPPRRGGCCNEF